MARQVCLFRISQEKNSDYDSYDSAIVAAYTIEEAREMHPSEYTNETVSELTALVKANADDYHYGLSDWAEFKHIEVEYIGIADIHIIAGDILCNSFNAG